MARFGYGSLISFDFWVFVFFISILPKVCLNHRRAQRSLESNLVFKNGFFFSYFLQNKSNLKTENYCNLLSTRFPVSTATKTKDWTNFHLHIFTFKSKTNFFESTFCLFFVFLFRSLFWSSTFCFQFIFFSFFFFFFEKNVRRGGCHPPTQQAQLTRWPKNGQKSQEGVRAIQQLCSNSLLKN
jgi:hypothetical protein